MSNEQEIIDELQECLDIGNNDKIALYPEEVQMCIDALEKQIKKKIERYSCNTIGEMTFNCPSCNLEYYVTDYEDFNYCPNCGQKIDWNEED